MMILVLKFLVIAVWASLALVTAFTRFVRGDLNSHFIDLFDASGPSLSSWTDLPRARSRLISLNPNGNLGRTLSTMTSRLQNAAPQRGNFIHCHRNPLPRWAAGPMRRIQTTFAYVFAAFAGKTINCRVSVIPVIAALILLLPFSVASAFADSETVSPRWKELVEFYIKNVFANGNLTLQKYDVGPKIPISLSCDGLTLEACDLAKSTFQHSWEPSPTFQMELSQKPIIEFVFTTDLQMSTISPNVAEDFSDGFSDVSDHQCEMFLKYSANRITRGKLLAVVDQPAKKLRACFVIQIPRLLGLDYFATEKFSIIWASAVNKSPDELLDQNLHTNGILEYIHMCPELVVGMNEEEVRKILFAPHSCISKIEGTK